MTDAAQILYLNQLWKEIDSDVLMNNIENILSLRGINSFAARMEVLAEITNSKQQTVYAWINRGRNDVKVPFIKLCMISEKLEVDIKELLQNESG